MSGSTSSSTNLSDEYVRTGDMANAKYNGDATTTDRAIASSDGTGENDDERSVEEDRLLERKLVRKIDLRLCTIAGILCSLNLLDSGIISSASVTSIFTDLGLGVGNRYVSF